MDLLSPHITYQNAKLMIEDVSVHAIAKKVSTPFYAYSAQTIQDQIEVLQNAFAKTLPKGQQPIICYASKANSNIHVLQQIRKHGCHVEVVTEGEL